MALHMSSELRQALDTEPNIDEMRNHIKAPYARLIGILSTTRAERAQIAKILDDMAHELEVDLY